MTPATVRRPRAAKRNPEELRREALVRRIQAMDPHRLTDFSFLTFRDADDRRIVAARHHHDWARVMTDRERFPWVVLVAPPGSAKSTWASMIYPAWRLAETDASVRIALISKTATQAYGNAQVVADGVTSDDFRTYFPEVRPHYRRGWRQNERFFTNTPAGRTAGLTAAGVGGPIQGLRFDEIVLDDPTDWSDARSREIMDGQRRFLTGLLIKRFPLGQGPPSGTGGRMLVAMTRWGSADLLPTLTDLGFRVAHMPALGYWDRTLRCPECGFDRDPDLILSLLPCEHCESVRAPETELGEAALWPEVQTKEALEEERANDQIIFDLVMQGDTSAVSGDIFDGDWFQRADAAPEMDRVVTGVDTASGAQQARGDYTVFATLGQREEAGEIWVLDVDRGRYTSPEQVRAATRNFERLEAMGFRPDMMVIEAANEGRALYQLLAAETRLPVTYVDPVKDKTFRAIPLSNAYRSKKVWHLAGPWNRSFEAELIAFDGTDRGRDDQVDAAAHAYAKLGPVGGFRLRGI